MSERVVVPEGMLDAACRASSKGMLAILEAALLWLSEHPIVPTDEQIEALHREVNPSAGSALGKHWENRNWLTEWQRRMFRAPEPEVDPEDRRYQQEMERLCGDSSFEMKAGFQRGWLAALKTASLPSRQYRKR